MTEELITYPTAILARKKGFDIKCSAGWEYYEFKDKVYGPTPVPQRWPDIHAYPPEERALMDQERQQLLSMRIEGLRIPFKNSALPPYLFARPTQDLLERWLREVHHVRFFFSYFVGPGTYYVNFGMLDKYIEKVQGAPFDTHELAREAALQHALNLLPDA